MKPFSCQAGRPCEGGLPHSDNGASQVVEILELAYDSPGILRKLGKEPWRRHRC